MSEQQKNEVQEYGIYYPYFWTLGGMGYVFVLKDEEGAVREWWCWSDIDNSMGTRNSSLWSVLIASLLSNLATTGATTTPIPDSGLLLP